MGVAGLFYELIRPGGEGAGIFFKKSNGTIWGVQLEATFLTAEISPNGDPKINLLTLSKGFFMKNFNNFDKKIEGKEGVPHISTMSFFNTILTNIYFFLSFL